MKKILLAALLSLSTAQAGIDITASLVNRSKTRLCFSGHDGNRDVSITYHGLQGNEWATNRSMDRFIKHFCESYKTYDELFMLYETLGRFIVSINQHNDHTSHNNSWKTSFHTFVGKYSNDTNTYQTTIATLQNLNEKSCYWQTHQVFFTTMSTLYNVFKDNEKALIQLVLIQNDYYEKKSIDQLQQCIKNLEEPLKQYTSQLTNDRSLHTQAMSLITTLCNVTEKSRDADVTRKYLLVELGKCLNHVIQNQFKTSCSSYKEDLVIVAKTDYALYLFLKNEHIMIGNNEADGIIPFHHAAYLGIAPLINFYDGRSFTPYPQEKNNGRELTLHTLYTNKTDHQSLKEQRGNISSHGYIIPVTMKEDGSMSCPLP
jgi:prefoldin subunit 5